MCCRLQKPPSLVGKCERVFGPFAQIARRAQQLQVRWVIRSTECERLEVVDVEAVFQSHRAGRAPPTLQQLQLLDVFRRVSATRAALASPVLRSVCLTGQWICGCPCDRVSARQMTIRGSVRQLFGCDLLAFRRISGCALSVATLLALVHTSVLFRCVHREVRWGLINPACLTDLHLIPRFLNLFGEQRPSLLETWPSHEQSLRSRT